jgi:hypothetical protein
MNGSRLPGHGEPAFVISSQKLSISVVYSGVGGNARVCEELFGLCHVNLKILLPCQGPLGITPAFVSMLALTRTMTFIA